MKLPNTPCCKYVRAFIKWLWNFLFAGKRFILNFIILPLLTAYTICLLWGYYTANVWVFNPLYYPYLPQKEKLALVCMIAYLLCTVIYALIMQRVRSERIDCSLRNAHIARLARLWLDEETIKAQAREAKEAWQRQRMEQLDAQAANRTLIVSTQIVGQFIQKRLAPFLAKFSNEEIEILRFLFNLLETRGRNVPSVASRYKNDYDITQFRRCNGSRDIPVTSDGRTSYEILAAYSLLNHTIRVASMMIEEIKSRTNTYSILMPRAVITALAHDIGKMEKIDASSVIDEVAKVTDHPYLSAMIIKERFPNYYDLESLTTVVREHHLPVDKNSTIYAASLKEADKRARRQEISAWFKAHYGTDAHPDPYVTVEEEDNNGEVKGGSDTARPENRGKSAGKSKERKSEAANRQETPKDATNKIASTGKTTLGDQFTPIEKEKTEGDFGLKTLPFKLEGFETVLLSKISAYPITIDQSKKSAFVSKLEIRVIPYKDMLLMGFATLLHIFRTVIVDAGLEDDDYTRMAHYAIGEWRSRGIVVNVGTGYSTRKFEYYNDGIREQAALVPFSMDKLMISSYERLDEAKKHPLFDQISDLGFARR